VQRTQGTSSFASNLEVSSHSERQQQLLISLELMAPAGSYKSITETSGGIWRHSFSVLFVARMIFYLQKVTSHFLLLQIYSTIVMEVIFSLHTEKVVLGGTMKSGPNFRRVTGHPD
jgi:hypothetical protein